MYYKMSLLQFKLHLSPLVQMSLTHCKRQGPGTIVDSRRIKNDQTFGNYCLHSKIESVLSSSINAILSQTIITRLQHTFHFRKN